MPSPVEAPFEYHGCHFVCSVVERAPNAYEPHVLYLHGIAGLERMPLPQDVEPYIGKAEALRHAQQQAVRWVHDRLGNPQAQF
jgi:hypothetical protein